MLFVVLLNALLGAVVGLWFRVQVLVPLIGVAIVEVVVLHRAGAWSSALWLAVALITSIELGYLLGSSASAFWQFSGRARVIRDFARHGHASWHH